MKRSVLYNVKMSTDPSDFGRKVRGEYNVMAERSSEEGGRLELESVLKVALDAWELDKGLALPGIVTISIQPGRSILIGLANS